VRERWGRFFLSRWWDAGELILLASAVALVIFLPIPVLVEFAEDWCAPAAFWGSLFFMLYYTSLAAWWGNPMGKMLIGLDFAVFLALGPGELQREFSVTLSPAVQLRIAAGALVLIPVVVLSRTWLLGAVNGWVPHWPWTHRRRAREAAAREAAAA
jgi:hypothetical protein